jgi:hypothetical protein
MMELVVVLAVLMLLFAVLAPIIGCGNSEAGLQHFANQRTCLANLRELFMGTIRYADNNGGYYPNSYSPVDAAKDPAGAVAMLNALGPYVADPLTWNCPDHAVPVDVPGDLTGVEGYKGATLKPSYGFNWYLAGAGSPEGHMRIAELNQRHQTRKFLILERSPYSPMGTGITGVSVVKVDDQNFWPEPRHRDGAVYDSANAKGALPNSYYEGFIYAVLADGSAQTPPPGAGDFLKGNWERYWKVQ